MTFISNSRLPELHTPQLAKADLQPRPAHLEVATELPGKNESPQQRGDRVLADLYKLDLKELSGANKDYRQHTVENIPRDSSFSQSRTLLGNFLKNPAFMEWAKEHDIDLSKEITINVDSGTLSGTTLSTRPQNAFDFSAPKPTAQSIDIHSFMGWPLLKSVAKTLAGSGNAVSFDPAATATAAKIADIAQFHGHILPFDSALSPSEQQAAVTEYINKWQREDDLFPETFNIPSQKYLDDQAAKLGDLNNRRAVIAAIPKAVDDVLKGLEHHFSKSTFAKEEDRAEYNQIIKERMQVALDTPIQIDPTSSYSRDHTLKSGVAVTLRDYLVGHGLLVPTDASELRNIAQSLASLPLPTPAYGNLGGAHSWPTPMSDNDKNELRFAINRSVLTEPGETVFDYLTRDLPTLNKDPRLALDDILKSSNAKHLAATADREVGELLSPDPVSDWVLTALYNSLDLWGGSDPSQRTKAAGFDLADVKLFGHSASMIRKALAEHLIEQKKATPKTVDLAVTLLLSHKAPELLVKDIPETLTKGTHSWVSFTTAVARLEAQAPGSTSQMTYSQVMMRHELAPITLADKLVEQQAQSDALKEWGVHNGVLDWNSTGQYSEEEMDKVRSAYTLQIEALSKASDTFAALIPDLHDRATAEIKAQNPHLSEEQIRQKVLVPKTSVFLSFPGPYSLLDIFIHSGQQHNKAELDRYRSSDENIDLSSINFKPMSNSDIIYQFENGLDVYFDRFERDVRTQGKYLVSTLSLEDRKIIEHGKLAVFKEVTFTKDPYTLIESTKDASPSSIFITSEIVNEQGHIETHRYELNSTDNTLRPRPDLRSVGSVSSDGKGVNRLVPLVPDGDYKANVLEAWTHDGVNDAPNSFASEKTQYIVDAMVKHFNIREQAASLRSTTTFDGEVPFYKQIEDFVVGLIPGYNATKNFIEGNWREGLVDLSFDIFGFLLAGAGKVVGAGAKVGSSTFGSTAKKLLRGTLGAFNPIDAKGIVQASVQTGITYFTNSGPADNNQPRIRIKYDPVKIFRDVENATIGKATVQGVMTEIAATQKNGKWYPLDPVSKEPLGLPSKDFVPSA